MRLSADRSRQLQLGCGEAAVARPDNEGATIVRRTALQGPLV